MAQNLRSELVENLQYISLGSVLVMFFFILYGLLNEQTSAGLYSLLGVGVGLIGLLAAILGLILVLVKHQNIANSKYYTIMFVSVVATVVLTTVFTN